MGNEFDQISALPFFAPYMQTWRDEINLKICLGFDIEAHLNCWKKRNANFAGLECLWLIQAGAQHWVGMFL